MDRRVDEAIEVVALKYDYLPAAFRWRNRRLDVIDVERVWTIQQPAGKRLFRVRCSVGSFLLEQRLADGGWRLRRHPLILPLRTTRRLASPQFPLPRRQRRPAPRRQRQHNPLQRAIRLLMGTAERWPAQRRSEPWTPTAQRL